MAELDDINKYAHNYIKGLYIIENFITKDEEKELIENINKGEWNTDLKRLTQHYGYKYNYRTRSITDDNYLGELPDYMNKYINRIINSNMINKRPDQIIINRYLKGEGIRRHVDRKDYFDNKIYSISLGSGCTMIYENLETKHKYYIYLKARSFLLMCDDARYKYTHAIQKCINDEVYNEKEKKMNIIPRDTRYSLTFRNVIKQESSINVNN